MDDSDLTQLICAYRLWNEDLEIPVKMKICNIIPIGITSMSAGSKTNPGGYVVATLEQFEISDERSASEIAKVISVKDMNLFGRLG
jgi:2-iminoacetate synthase